MIPTNIFTAENSTEGQHIMIYPNDPATFFDLPTNDPGGKLKRASLALK